MSKRGRPAYKPEKGDRALVGGLAMMGTPQDEIAKVLGISKNTLKKHFLDELKSGMEKANARVVASLFNSCIKGNVAAQIFWCKTRLGWSEKSQIEVTTPVQEIFVELSDGESFELPFPQYNGVAADDEEIHSCAKAAT